MRKKKIIILDTNLLLLFIVGKVSTDLIKRHKKVDSFDKEDFDQLAKILANAEEVLFTPNTLTETSNLLAYIGEPSKTLLFEYFAKLIGELKEIVIASRDVAEDKHFYRLGLTDAVLIRSSEADNTVVLTTDLDLWAALQREGRESWNFNHLRDARWSGVL